MRLAGPLVCLDGLRCAVVALVLAPSAVEPSRALPTHHLDADLQEDALNRRDRRPSRVGQELHTHGTPSRDMTAAPRRKGEETGSDDSDKGRAEGVILSKADLEDDAGDACSLHVLGERKRGVE